MSARGIIEAECDFHAFLLLEDEAGLWEAYSDPQNELRLEIAPFKHGFKSGDWFKATVKEQSTGEDVASIEYGLKTGNPVLDVSNIEAAKNKNKPVWTTRRYSSTGGGDLGYRAVRWLLKTIAQDARARGYPVKQWQTSTRISGAFAKSKFKDGGPVRVRTGGGKLDEHLICDYWTETDTFTVTRC